MKLKRTNRQAIQEPLERRVMLAAVPVGPEFQVNTYTTNRQFEPSVGMDADGNFVIAWSSTGQDGSDNGVYAQRYNAAGMPQGDEFGVNTYAANRQFGPSVGMDAGGGFVIAWWSNGQDGSGYGVFAQRYSAAGSPLGDEFRVNTYTTGDQGEPSVGMDADGDFVIAWQSRDQDGSGMGVYAQRHSAAGAPQGSEFRVNTYTTNWQSNPSVAMDADGDFVVAWSGAGAGDPSNGGVFAQRYNAAGAPQGSEFRVNTYTTSWQNYASVGMDADGDFVIAWQSSGQDGSITSVYAQRYNAAGVRQGGEFRVNTYIDWQTFPSVGMDADGDFVIAWMSLGQDGDRYGVYAQQYNAAGVPQGGEFRVNTYTTDEQTHASVGMDADGNFVVAWTSSPPPISPGTGQDGSGSGVFAQRYAVVAAPAVNDSSFLFETAPQGLSFIFNQNVGASLDLSDIIVQALPAGPTVNPTAVSFNPTTNIASFTFGSILPDGNYRATLLGAGIIGPGGPMAADYTFDFFFLTGDANRDGRVNLADFNILAGNFGQSARIFSQGNFDYDPAGNVNLADFNLLAARFGMALGATFATASTNAVSGQYMPERVADELLGSGEDQHGSW